MDIMGAMMAIQFRIKRGKGKVKTSTDTKAVIVFKFKKKGFVGLNINVHDNHNTTGSNFRIIIRETVPYFNVHANFIYGY